MAGGTAPLDARCVGRAGVRYALDDTRAPEIVRLARNLGEIGHRLRAEDAELATDRLVAALGKLSDQVAVQTILRGLQAVAPRLAEVGAGKAAIRISSDLARSRIASAIDALTRALTIIVPRLAPGTTGRLAAAAADSVVGALVDANRPEDIRHLAEALGDLASFLDQDTGESMLVRLAAARTPMERLRLVSGLAALAPALRQQEAGRVAEQDRRAAARALRPRESGGRPSPLGRVDRGGRSPPRPRASPAGRRASSS